MKSLLLIFVILISANLCYADDCVYDQDAQIELLKSIAKSHPDGVIDLREKAITWSSPLTSASSIQYGGCEHLGYSVTKNISTSKSYSESEIFTLAITLANEYWSPSDAAALNAAIAEKSFTKAVLNNSTFIHIPREYYSEFYIEQNFTAGYVTIVWVRNF
jgi:hypothetical protein